MTPPRLSVTDIVVGLGVPQEGVIKRFARVEGVGMQDVGDAPIEALDPAVGVRESGACQGMSIPSAWQSRSKRCRPVGMRFPRAMTRSVNSWPLSVTIVGKGKKGNRRSLVQGL